jgi:hypothetical protein
VAEVPLQKAATVTDLQERSIMKQSNDDTGTVAEDEGRHPDAPSTPPCES